MAELLLRSLALLAEIVLEIIIGYVFYTTGWLALRLLTLDRYPICRCLLYTSSQSCATLIEQLYGLRSGLF